MGFRSTKWKAGVRLRHFASSYQAGLAVPSDKKILLNMDGSNGGTSFSDASGKLWTRSGTPTISTAQVKYGSASGLFNGSQGISTPHAIDLYLGQLDFQWSAWIYSTSSAVQDLAAHRHSADNTNFYFFRKETTNKLRFLIKTKNATHTDISTTGTITNNQWVHVRCNRIAGVSNLFIGGVVQSVTGSQATTIAPPVPYPFWVGCGDNSVAGGMIGYMDDVCLEVGGTYSAASFTPPTAGLSYP